MLSWLTKHIGFVIVMFAIAVLSPRLTLLFLEADGVPAPESWHRGLLAASSGAMAVVLCGGAAYLAHAVVRRRCYRTLILSCWIVLLVFLAVLLPPMLVSSLRTVPLNAVIAPGWPQWLWSLVAVLAPELVAGGVMAAVAASELEQEQYDEEELYAVAAERDRLAQQVARLRGDLERARASRPVAVPDEDEVVYRCPAGCDWTGGSPRAVAGHLRTCPAKEEGVAYSAGEAVAP